MLQTTALDITDDSIRAIHVVRNPHKIGHVAAKKSDWPLDSGPSRFVYHKTKSLDVRPS